MLGLGKGAKTADSGRAADAGALIDKPLWSAILSTQEISMFKLIKLAVLAAFMTSAIASVSVEAKPKHKPPLKPWPTRCC
jgi:hypothetical protein